MADVVLMADAEMGAEADRLIREFAAAVEAMRRRRAAAGSHGSGAMLTEIRTIGEASLDALKAKAEAVFVATWPRSLWVSETEEAALMASAREHLETLHATVRERVRTAARNIAAQPTVLEELEPLLDACLDRCKERLVLVLQQQRQAGSASILKRGLSLIPSVLNTVGKWLIGLLPGK